MAKTFVFFVFFRLLDLYFIIISFGFGFKLIMCIFKFIFSTLRCFWVYYLLYYSKQRKHGYVMSFIYLLGEKKRILKERNRGFSL